MPWVCAALRLKVSQAHGMLGDKNEVPAGSHYMEIRNREEEKNEKEENLYKL